MHRTMATPIKITSLQSLDDPNPARPAKRRASFVSRVATFLERNIGLRLISVGLAIALWIFVNAGQHTAPETFVVPVTYRDLPPGFILTNQHPETIRIQVTGPRTLLSIIDPAHLTLRLDLTGVGIGQASFKISPDVFPVPRHTEVTSIVPSQIVLDVDKNITREVPVHLIVSGDAADGYRIAATEVTPARIVLLVDNSLTIRADVDKLEKATLEFAYEMFDGDKLLIVGYDNNAEIVSDWTDNAKKIEAELKTFRKKGDPHLFDSILAVIEDGLRPLSAQKRAIVVISDGLDRGSKAKFKQVLSALQALDVTVYCVQAQDRTRGAIRRDVPKPRQVIDDLAEGTGGRIFPIEDPTAAAKAICDELRKNRYVLSYLPQSIPYTEERRLMVLGEPGINARAKTMQPPD